MTCHEKLRIGVKTIELEKQSKLKKAKKIRWQTPMLPLSGKICQGTFWPGFSDKIRLEFDGSGKGTWTRLT
jgi:hypothetical protein